MNAHFFQAQAVTGSVEGRDAFADFIRPHWADMSRLARRLAPDAQWEDVLQEALSAAWRKRQQFDPDRGTPRSWLFAIVADQAFKGRRRLRLTTELVDVPVEAVDVTGDLALQAGLGTLTPRQRTAVVLHYYLDLPVAEVATALGCRPGTVKSTLSDARAKLRRHLGEDFGND